MSGKINPKHWYIVDLRRPTRDGSYYILQKSFNSKKEAQDIIEANIKDKHNEIYFDIIPGKEVIEFRFKSKKPTNDKASYLDYLRKYDYPPELETIQQKKSFRTKYRRWKRDFKKELKKGLV